MTPDQIEAVMGDPSDEFAFLRGANAAFIEEIERLKTENERLEKAAYTALNSLVDFRCPEDEISELVSVIDARDILSVQRAIKALDEVLD